MKYIKYSSPEPTEMFPEIKPAKFFVPEWYKEIPAYNNKNIGFVHNNTGHNSPLRNVKNCLPFLDCFISGYIIQLLCDIHVNSNEKESKINWEYEFAPVERRLHAEKQNKTIPVPKGYSTDHYAWRIPHSFNLPDDSSFLITHPFNRLDLPFITLSGIVDGGWNMWPGNLPFFIREDFNGIIPAGTPIAQIIPFVQNDWKIEYDQKVFELSTKDHRLKFKTFFDYYKNKYRKDKSKKYR